MPTESGYSNTKKQGRAVHKTLHPLGSSRVGQHVVTKMLVERQAVPVAITGVQQNSTDTLIRITLAGHGALVGDVVRFYSGALQGAELEVVTVEDVNTFIIRNIVGVPSVSDTVKVMYYVTPKSDAEGNVNFSPGPTTYSQDNVTTVVAEDTANPANNKSLPSLVMFYKDGAQIPVLEDTVTPANNDPLPVKLVGYTGDVNITAGDLNVSTNATNDSMAIGDSVTGNKAEVSLNSDAATYALKVKDDDANTLLSSIDAGIATLDTSTLATEVTLASVDASLTLIAAEDFATETTLATVAKETTLGAVKTAVELIDDVVNTDGNPSGTKGILIGGIDGSGDFQAASVNPAGELSVSFSSAGFATETTLAALNNKHNADFGASTGAIRTAAQIGNATGAADFNAGADGAQTLRVSANLKRNGNELSYNSGAADANTQRTVLATRHESDNTPIATRLSNGSNWLSDEAIANSQKTISGGSHRSLLTTSVALGWDGSDHREIAVNSSGHLKTVEDTRVMNSTVNFTAAGNLTPPAGAKGFTIQNSSRSGGALRFAPGSGVASASVGFLLEPGQSTSYQDGAPSVLSIGDVDTATLDGCVIWYV
jgi:hypothetical protein